MGIVLRLLALLTDWKQSWFSRQCVGLLDEKLGFELQARHQNKIQKVFFRRFPLSRLMARTLRVNKIAMKSFSKNLSHPQELWLQHFFYAVKCTQISRDSNRDHQQLPIRRSVQVPHLNKQRRVKYHTPGYLSKVVRHLHTSGFCN